MPIAFNEAKTQHWHEYNKLKKEWHKIVFLYSRGKLPPSPLTKVKLTLHRFHANKWLDYDGLASSFKAPVDGLVEAGILISDGWTITGKWDCDQFRIKKAEAPYIKIKIEEVTTKESVNE